MENSIELTTTHVVPKKRKIKDKYIRCVDFPYKAKQIFGLGGENDARKTR